MTKDLANKEDLAQARATASQIRQGIHNYLHTLTLIAKAHQQRHWKVLGYKDWQEYVDGEFGAERLRLPAEHRQKAVEELRLAGMSQRAIGSALGVDEKTVRNDLAGAEFSAPEQIQGTDGKTYAASRPKPEEVVPASEGWSGPASSSRQPAPPPVEADAQLAVPGSPAGAREGLDGVAPPEGSGDGTGARTPVPPTAVEVDTPSADASGEESWPLDSDVAAAAPASARGGADVGVSPLVQAAMDKYAPDPNPHREWQKKFLADVHAVHRVMRYDVDVVAVQADSTCIEELGRVFELLDEYRTKVLAALTANLPDNVRPMRRSS